MPSNLYPNNLGINFTPVNLPVWTSPKGFLFRLTCVYTHNEHDHKISCLRFDISSMLVSFQSRFWKVSQRLRPPAIIETWLLLKVVAGKMSIQKHGSFKPTFCKKVKPWHIISVYSQSLHSPPSSLVPIELEILKGRLIAKFLDSMHENQINRN